MARALLIAAQFAFAAFGTVSHAQPALGAPAPSFEVELIDGRALNDGWSAGKIVLVMFWATWCPFCRADMPEMQQLYDLYRPSGLEVLAISLDRELSDVKTFVGKGRYSFPVAMRTPELREGFGPIKGTPTYFLIDRDGRLRWSHIGGVDRRVLEPMIVESTRRAAEVHVPSLR